MRKLILVPMLVATVVACSSSDGEPEGPCARRSGSYLVTYTERSGNCGEGGERVVNLSAQPKGLGPNCTGTGPVDSADNCEVTYDSTCPEDGIVKGGKLRITGKSKWNVAGTEGTATETWFVTNPDGSTICASTYDLAARKQ